MRDRFNISRGQYKFLKKLLEYNEDYIPIKEVFALDLLKCTPPFILSLFQKHLILAENSKVRPNMDLKGLKRLINNGRRVRINPMIVSFLLLLEEWFD